MARLARTVSISFAAFVLCCGTSLAQWISFTDQTATRFSYSAVNTDPEEKDFAVADMDNDGDLDLVNVRKEGFYAQGSRTHILFMNVAGVLTDLTSTYAPTFLTNPSLARAVVVADFDGDTWNDVVVANTDSQQSQYYRNLGNNGSGQWLGLIIEANRLPIFSPGPRFCSAAGGDADNDGDVDLFLGDYNNNLENRLLINNGLGVFTDQTSTRFAGGIPQSGFSTEAVFLDFNNDGALDIMDTQAGSTGIHLNNNTGVVGQFTARILVNGNANYTSAAGDLNNDGKADLYAGQDGQDGYLINTTPTASMSLSFSTITLQSTNSAAANFSPHTTGFAGNPYIVDLDNDGFKDIAMADTDVDVPGCARRAVLTKNIFGTTSNPGEVLTTPYGTTLQNFNTLGTHDVAVFDLNGDGWNDVISGLCTGYKAFIQVPPFPVGLTLAINEPVQGAVDLQVSLATPSTPVYNLFSTQITNPAGTGPFFGLGTDAFTLFVALYPLEPVVGMASSGGTYSFGAPGGSLPAGFQLQARSIQIEPSGYTLSNVVTKTW
jgi:hypothetical protein